MKEKGSPADSSPVTSLSLLQRARAQDAEAWRLLNRLYRPLVLFWCARRGVGPDDAEDVAQDVFRSIMAGLDGFRRDRPGDSFRAWLRGVTHNWVLQYYRRVGRHPEASGGSEAMRQLQEVVAPEDEDDPAEQISQLYRRALDLVRGEFEDRTWQMFWRSVIDEEAPGTVAESLGVSTAAVRQARSRVLRRLKEEVGDLIT